MVTGGRYATAQKTGFTSRTSILVAMVLAVFAVSLLTFSHGSLNLDITRLDLEVYRLGAKAWLDGASVYGKLPAVESGLDLGFTYPPISAVVMVPLAVVPARVAGALMTALTIGLLLAVLALFLRTADLVPDKRTGWRWAAALLPLAALIEPVRTTLAFGQINVVLMALVAFDCLLPRTRWPRGVLTGVAAALKLTPIVFVLYFVATRQYKAAAWSVVGAAGVTALGLLLAPSDSIKYWTVTVFQTNRVGSQSFFDNQSLTGLLSRAGLAGSSFTLAWLVCCALVGGLGLLAVRSTFRRGAAQVAEDAAIGAGRPDSRRHLLLPLALTACVSLCVSPISWSHHWVWASPVLITAFAVAWRNRADFGARRRLWLLAPVAALFAVFPASLFARSDNVNTTVEMHWSVWQDLLGSAYVYVAVGLIAYFGVNAAVEYMRGSGRTAADAASGAVTSTHQDADADEDEEEDEGVGAAASLRSRS